MADQQYTYTPQGQPTQKGGHVAQGHPVNQQPGAYAPAAYAAPPGISYMAQPNSGVWTTDLCACGDDCSSCWCAWCCPCVLVGRTANILDQGMTSVFTGAAIFFMVQWFTGCGCLYSCLYRAKLRQKFGLREDPCNDIVTECCCNCCSIAQVYRELKNRNIDPKLGYEFARAVYEQPPAQAPPRMQEMHKM